MYFDKKKSNPQGKRNQNFGVANFYANAKIKKIKKIRLIINFSIKTKKISIYFLNFRFFYRLK